MKTFWIFWEWKLRTTSSPWILIFLRSFWPLQAPRNICAIFSTSPIKRYRAPIELQDVSHISFFHTSIPRRSWRRSAMPLSITVRRVSVRCSCVHIGTFDLSMLYRGSIGDMGNMAKQENWGLRIHVYPKLQEKGKAKSSVGILRITGDS